MTDQCQACCSVALESVLHLGPQPITNRFPSASEEPEFTHPFTLGVCTACGLAQQLDPAPADELRPRVDWISYREPEAHLDQVAREVAALPGVGARSQILGLSQYDEPLLERLRRLGMPRAEVLDWRYELGVVEPFAGVETLQSCLTAAAGSEIATLRGQVDVLVVRYVLEHAQAIHELLGGLRRLLRPGGHLVVEVPDCAGPFESSDVGVLWEEHALYFTADTLESCLAAGEFTLQATVAGISAAAIVAIAREGGGAARDGDVRGEVARIQAFGSELLETRRRWADFLDDQAREGRRVALLGAGHIGAMVVNALALESRLACVIDDHPRKQGLRMPGSRLPIAPSQTLIGAAIGVCLLAVSPEAEERIAEAHAGWERAGGRFFSVAPQSPRHPFSTVNTP